MRCRALMVAMALSAGVAVASPPALQLKRAWIRWLPGTVPAGGYAVLSNEGDRPQTLIGASSPDYGSVELHQSRTVQGVSQMLSVARLSIAPHSTLDFAAQGYHFMLKQPRHALKPGDHVSITLQFDGGTDVSASFEVRPPGASQDMSDMPGMAGMK